MREVIIDGNFMKSKEEMHDHLKMKFGLPYYYARNLDSLYQILLKEEDPVNIVLVNKENIALGYGDALTLLLKDLCVKNHNYSFEVK